MILILELVRRLSIWQESNRNRFILSVVFIVCGASILAPLCWSAYKYAELRKQIATVISEANIAEKNPISMQLIERGTVTVNGLEIGGPRIQSVATDLFAADGKIEQVVPVSSFIASTVAPRWAPVAIIERPEAIVLSSITIISLCVLAVWVGMGIQLALIALLTVSFMMLFWWSSQFDFVVGVAGIGFLIFLFLLLMRITLVLLGSSLSLFGIAHTLLLEALRNRIPISFIGVLLVVLPLLPIWIDRREPLRYQIQTYLSRGMSLTFVVAAGLTLFLSCATVAFEIRDRQIWNVLTKPVSHFQYLAGKLFGLSILNGIILLVGGLAVFLNLQLMTTRSAIDRQDLAAVQDQVLVAREVARPAYTEIDLGQLRDGVINEIEKDSLLRQEIADGIRSEVDIAREIRTRKTTEFMSAQRTIQPGKSRTYEFSGLSAAKQAGAQPVLRYSFHIGNDSSHDTFPVLFSFGENQPMQVNYVPVQRNVVSIPIDAIGDDGKLTLKILNGGLSRDGQLYFPESSINFDASGLEILHRVGGFEANLFRAILIDFGKLTFISAFGVAAASVLSFPVAVLLTVSVFLAGSLSSFIALSLATYYSSSDANYFILVFEFVIRTIVGFVYWMLAPFGNASSSADLVDGRAILWSAVIRSIAQVGLLWSLIVFGIGVIAFKRKEIAIYSGGGG